MPAVSHLCRAQRLTCNRRMAARTHSTAATLSTGSCRTSLAGGLTELAVLCSPRWRGLSTCPVCRDRCRCSLRLWTRARTRQNGSRASPPLIAKNTWTSFSAPSLLNMLLLFLAPKLRHGSSCSTWYLPRAVLPFSSVPCRFSAWLMTSSLLSPLFRRRSTSSR